MKPYNTYKDSGIEWIGAIPSHWEVKSLKRLAKIGNGQDHKNVWDENGEYPIIGTGGVFGKANNYLHKGPSVLLGRKGTIDRPQFVETPFWSVDTAYYTDINSNVHPKLFYYLCTTINFDLYKYGSAVPSMTQEVLNQIPFVISKELQEQTAIATYLDRKIEEIDALIADKKHLLELYEEEKTAIINQAVTKSIDPKVKMKDSGIEWLGEIPEHWEVSRIKSISKYFKGFAFKSSDFEYSGIPIVKASNIKKWQIIDISSFIAKANQREEFEKVRLEKGDVILSTVGSKPDVINSAVGQLASVSEEFQSSYLNQNTLCLRPSKQMNDLFFKYTFLSRYFRSSLDSISSWIANQAYLEIEDILSIQVVIPGFEEQTRISQFIETECARIDAKIAKTQKLIELLTEYRTALISEVVTGKIKVID